MTNLTRRDLLRMGLSLQGLRVSALLPAFPAFGAAEPARAEDGTVLVVLQLTGGNDGLNTVVPFTQDAYYRRRPFLGLARGELHRLDDDHGLHPAMGGLGEQFAQGRLAVVHGVGHPNPDRSHFRSLEIWHTADPAGPAGEIGWLGRMTDALARRTPGTLAALAIEAGNLPLSMRGESFLVPTVSDPLGFRTNAASAVIEEDRGRLLALPASANPPANANLKFLREAARSTYATAKRMAAITANEPVVPYPDHTLGQQMRLVSQLVRGGFGTRVFHLTHGGYDTHARQAPVHAERLRQVSTALDAFQRELVSAGVSERVVVFVFSEFGRRVQENASKGTDHGRGAPAFLMGTPVLGRLHGTAPDLDELVDGDVPATTDFRSIYTTLEQWMGVTASTELPPLELLDSR